MLRVIVFLFSFLIVIVSCKKENPCVECTSISTDTLGVRVGPKPTVDVISLAKKDLKAGEILDGPGFYTVYGECENSNIVQAENLVPIGMADKVKLKNDVAKDATISFDDIEYDPEVTLFKLYKEQIEHF